MWPDACSASCRPSLVEGIGISCVAPLLPWPSAGAGVPVISGQCVGLLGFLYPPSFCAATSSAAPGTCDAGACDAPHW